MFSPEMWNGLLDSLQRRTGLLTQHVLLNHKSMPRAGTDYAWTVQPGAQHLDIKNFKACFGEFDVLHDNEDYIQYLESICLDLLFIITQRVKSGQMHVGDISNLTVGCSDRTASFPVLDDLRRITTIMHPPPQAQHSITTTNTLYMSKAQLTPGGPHEESQHP